MKKAAFSVISFMLYISSVAAFQYENVSMANTDLVDGYIVKYLVAYDSPCVTVETKVPGAKEIRGSIEICAIHDKSFWNDFADIHLVDGVFLDNGLRLQFSVTQLRGAGEQFLTCVVRLEEGMPLPIECPPLQDR